VITRRSRDLSDGCQSASAVGTVRSGVAVGLRRVSFWPLPGTMLILMAGSFGCGERSNACAAAKVWCLGHRSHPDRVGVSRYRSPRARRCCLTVSARRWSG